jgi:hypothetical protein
MVKKKLEMHLYFSLLTFKCSAFAPSLSFRTDNPFIGDAGDAIIALVQIAEFFGGALLQS